MTRDERDILEALLRLELAGQTAPSIDDINAVAGIGNHAYAWRAVRSLRDVGAITRGGPFGRRGTKGNYHLTERGKIALALQIGMETRALTRRPAGSCALGAGTTRRP